MVLGLGLPLLAILLIPCLAIIVLFSMGQGNGAQASRPIEPKPGSASQTALTNLKRYSQSSQYLAQNGPKVIDSLRQELDKVGTEIDAHRDSPKYSDASNLLTKMRDELTTIQANATSNRAAANTAATQFMKDRDTLENFALIITGGGTANISSGNPDVASCQKLANMPDKLTFDQPNDHSGFSNGKITRKDGTPIDIDPKLCKFLDSVISSGTLQGAYPIKLMSVVGHHSQYVAGHEGDPNRESRHWTGHAVDIWEPANKPSVAAKLMPWVVENRGALAAGGIVPSQVIGPRKSDSDGGNYTRYAVNHSQSAPGFFVPGHNNHVHVGF